MNDRLKLHFLNKGLLTSLQDEGRRGYQAFGVPIGGSMDRISAQLANWLVSNEAHESLLEISLIGPKIAFEGSGHIAITGADLSPSLNGHPLALYQSHQVKDGDVLSFGKCRSGCRAYLAIGGQWQVDQWLGSSSLTLPIGLELMPKSLITKDQIINIQSRQLIPQRHLSKEQSAYWDRPDPIRVLPGPDFTAFSSIDIAHFFRNIHQIASTSNRMAYRLDSDRSLKLPQKELISSGVYPGTIQINNAGKAMILMADAQTTGGYYRLGQVIQADLGRLAQKRPGEHLQLAMVSLSQAQQAWKNQKAAILDLLS